MSKDDFIFICYIIFISLILYTLSSIWSMSFSLKKIINLEQQRIELEQQNQERYQNIELSLNSLVLSLKIKNNI